MKPNHHRLNHYGLNNFHHTSLIQTASLQFWITFIIWFEPSLQRRLNPRPYLAFIIDQKHGEN
ncbi:MAG: hypothetical protein GPOALKHO_000327 [Sodalis sp.]|nr:MAG: hypothetical protein GPOALKHO_000327 [Sodalis sp.]